MIIFTFSFCYCWSALIIILHDLKCLSRAVVYTLCEYFVSVSVIGTYMVLYVCQDYTHSHKHTHTTPVYYVMNWSKCTLAGLVLIPVYWCFWIPISQAGYYWQLFLLSSFYIQICLLFLSERLLMQLRGPNFSKNYFTKIIGSDLVLFI